MYSVVSTHKARTRISVAQVAIFRTLGRNPKVPKLCQSILPESKCFRLDVAVQDAGLVYDSSAAATWETDLCDTQCRNGAHVLDHSFQALFSNVFKDNVWSTVVRSDVQNTDQVGMFG